ILVPLVALTYLVFVLIKMIEKKDSQFHESFMEKEKQMLAFAEKTFEHTLTITRMVDVLNVLVGKLK
ncbi:MAG: hypothetical protein KKD77_20855, partial [Gammaproteobacteria bacterium]|nr:hypothetical protein [Gammaproteobacteria bacterium]